MLCYVMFFFLPMPLCLVFNTQTMHFKSIIHNSIGMFPFKNFIPWRDLNPGLLFLRRTRCLLCQGYFHKYVCIFQKNTQNKKMPELQKLKYSGDRVSRLGYDLLIVVYLCTFIHREGYYVMYLPMCKLS
jgi:hypothetical protein